MAQLVARGCQHCGVSVIIGGVSDNGKEIHVERDGTHVVLVMRSEKGRMATWMSKDTARYISELLLRAEGAACGPLRPEDVSQQPNDK